MSRVVRSIGIILDFHGQVGMSKQYGPRSLLQEQSDLNLEQSDLGLCCCYSVCILWMCYSMIKLPSSNFRILKLDSQYMYDLLDPSTHAPSPANWNTNRFTEVNVCKCWKDPPPPTNRFTKVNICKVLKRSNESSRENWFNKCIINHYLLGAVNKEQQSLTWVQHAQKVNYGLFSNQDR